MSTETKTKAEAILNLFYPRLSKMDCNLIDWGQHLEVLNLDAKDLPFITLSIIYWFISREPAKVIIFCQGDENCTKVNEQLLNSIGYASIKLPIVHHKDCEFRKVTRIGKTCPSSCITIRQATGEGMLGHVLAKQQDNEPRSLVIFYQVSEDDVAKYRQKTDTWSDRTLIVNV